MQLRSIKKYSTDGNVSTRVKSAEETLAKIYPIGNKIGITRISDITYLDKLNIPNYSSILPNTEDSIWVYSGKGTTKIYAKASAIMESIERYCSLQSKSSQLLIHGNYSELSKIYNKVLHPDEVVEAVEPTYDNNSPIDYVKGFDILNNNEVLVPAQLVYSRFFPEFPSVKAFSYSHTNGLASGNVIEEAICHALCEVIERDSVSIADLCSSSIPYTILENIIGSLKKNKNYEHILAQIPEDKFVDDSSIFSDIDISQAAKEFYEIKSLAKRFSDANISLLIKDVTQVDIGVPTFVASSVEWITNDYGYFARGYGSHPDTRIALIRAITELSQTRAANIQGARDDFKKIKYKENDEIYKRKWEFVSSISSDKTNKKNLTMFSEIRTFVKNDILDDIKLILNRLKKSGIKRVIIVDLTNPDIRIPVVRAIVPGLETFEVAKLFTTTSLFIGKRAKIRFSRIRRI